MKRIAMHMITLSTRCIALFLVTLLGSSCSKPAGNASTAGKEYVSQQPTHFEVDPFWPKPLPNHWILGEVAGVAIDARDHVWIIQRPKSLTDREINASLQPPASECCAPAPSVIEFDPEGNVVQAWGNPDTTKQWITTEHGIFVDQKNNVWIGGNNEKDHVVLKFSAEGKLLLQIGEWGITKGSDDTTHLGRPADIAVDTAANEVYIADGYGNRRVIVFDANTGEYKRHWGAYGEAPKDGVLPPYDPRAKPSPYFANPVHAVALSVNNKLYVADRTNNRIQVFSKDGKFQSEGFVATHTLGAGSVWDIEFSRDAAQTYLYIADGMNMKIWILDRASMNVVGSVGQGGRGPGQFGWVHNLTMDSKGNLYTTEVRPGMRVQKFRPVP